MPELEGLYGSNKTAMEQRRDGGVALLDKAFQERVNGKYLSEFGSGYKFVVMTRDKPKMTSDGMVDLKGVKIRGTATYKSFYDELGINRVSLFAGEIYNALERGVVDGVGWTTVGITDGGWERFLKYRVHPYFMQGGFILVTNLDAWNKLSDAGRKCVQDKVLEHEVKAHNHFKEEEKRELDKMIKAGAEVIELKGDAAKRYLSAFQDSHWKHMVETLKLPQARVDEIKKIFYDASRPIGVFEPAS